MAITYDKAMQLYFGMYAATMTTFPEEYVPPTSGPTAVGEIPAIIYFRGVTPMRAFPNAPAPATASPRARD